MSPLDNVHSFGSPIQPQAAGLYDPRWEHDACGIAFVVDVKGRKSHDIVAQALQALQNLRHRGASGYETTTGDGAGIVLQVPHGFLSSECNTIGVSLPAPGMYGIGMVFLPQDYGSAQECRYLVEMMVAGAGLLVLGWRDVPRDNSAIGMSARAGEPLVQQVFVGGTPHIHGSLDLEQLLYLVRRRIEKAIQVSDIAQREMFYIASLSSRTIIYKGMLTADQLPEYFPDLTNPDVESALALVHQRFSTNTFPSWSLAHPYRYLSHNGEINTLHGNINWMRAREQLFESDVFGAEIAELLPIIQEGGSDSAALDNALEFLVMNGRSLPHAMMMLIPEPWQHHSGMNEVQKAFYNYHSALMEPWDGPAALAFTDGVSIGALLDRNGLRPGRYYVTHDDVVILASEVGVLDIQPENVAYKGRLEPGKMLLIDTEQGRIIPDSEIKSKIAASQPFGRWLAQERVRLEDLPPALQRSDLEDQELSQLQRVFGYTQEEKRLLLGPMALKAEEPIGSMGDDTPLAVLSTQSKLLFNYFKQMFAQVTNPPIDAIREELVTSMSSLLGPGGNVLKPGADSCRQIEIPSPIFDNDNLARLRSFQERGFTSAGLPMIFAVKDGSAGLTQAMDELCRNASEAISAGSTLLILSDRQVDANHAPIPSLLATAGLHHHLVREGTRAKVGLVIETGEAREIHHFCLLIGYGASAVNPYLALDVLSHMVQDGSLPDLDREVAIRQYTKSLNKGILKVMSKMGISTIDSYRGAQIFEAVGLDQTLVERYFTGTPSRIGGIGIDVIAQDVLSRHQRSFSDQHGVLFDLESSGQYQWRRDGEHHAVNPDMIQKLQHATRTNQYSIYKEYTQLVDEHSRELATIRGLLELKSDREPVPLEEVEPVESILRRFATGAMSFGAISTEAHETLAIAMNRIGGKSNSGEGGEDRVRFIHDSNGDWRSSAVKQVASGRFGVTSEYLVNAKELQIKMAQGAKPGEGGQLPGEKVDAAIARVRHSTPGVGLISPPPHHDIYSIEDLAQLIYDLKNANPAARISVKLVAEVGVGTVAAGVAKAHADVVLISGHDGGTGAAPLTGMKHAGSPWELGLAEAQQVLVMNNLRDRIIVQTDGQLKTGRDVVVAALLGAEEYGFATAPLVVLGCVMMRVCHMNTCPVGIATQDPELRKRFAGKPEHVETFFRFIAQDVREHMSRLGFRTMDEMIGRVDRLDARRTIDHYKAQGLDLSNLLYQPVVPSNTSLHQIQPQNHGLELALDNRLIELAHNALEHGLPVSAELPIRNVNRTVGTMLGSEISSRYGESGLPDDTIKFTFCGSAGQSFGAFIPRGLTLTLEGDANDYVGKGLSGGRIVVYPPRASVFRHDENVLLGNVALYGATSGEAFFSGVAGERFAVRNSGADAVVEGVGDHGCEYMTGGHVVILGRVGRNFAAGMSGGIAYVLDETRTLERLCNHGLVGLEEPDEYENRETIRALVERHYQLTGSARAAQLLARWEECSRLFVKVIPHEYRRVLEQNQRVQDEMSEVRYA